MDVKLHGSLYLAGLLISLFLAPLTYGVLDGVVETTAEGAYGMAIVLGLVTLVGGVVLCGTTALGILGATGLDK